MFNDDFITNLLHSLAGDRIPKIGQQLTTLPSTSVVAPIFWTQNNSGQRIGFSEALCTT